MSDEIVTAQNLLTLPEQTHEDVGTEGPFVGLIQDDDTIPIQVSFVQGLSKENAVRHVCMSKGEPYRYPRQDIWMDVHLILVSGEVQSSKRIA